MGFNCLTATGPIWGDSFYDLVPRSSWYSIDQPWKDERLSWPRNHPVLLNLGTLDWKSSALTTKLHPEKLVLKPTQSLIYLSFIIDRREKTKIYDLYSKRFEKSKPTIWFVKQVTGNIVATFVARSLEPLFYWALETEKIVGLRRHRQNYDTETELSNEACSEFVWWQHNKIIFRV